jgi:hypothetical protein
VKKFALCSNLRVNERRRLVARDSALSKTGAGILHPPPNPLSGAAFGCSCGTPQDTIIAKL